MYWYCRRVKRKTPSDREVVRFLEEITIDPVQQGGADSHWVVGQLMTPSCHGQ